MPSKGTVYVAGTGLSPIQSGGDANKTTIALVSAATKALLDAGITYDDVSHGVRSKKSSHASKAFKAFDEGGIKVDEVKDEDVFDASLTLVGEKHMPCVLVSLEEKSDAIALVLVSENFLWSRPFLKDSAVLMSKSGSSQGKSKQSLHDLCQAVWALRGWSAKESKSGKDEKRSWQAFELSRADGQSVPKWEDIKYRQDGKHRLGYNPARETKNISRYLFEGVRAEGKQKADKSIDFERKGSDRTALAKL